VPVGHEFMNLQQWRADLEKDENWRSAAIMTIIRLVNYYRDADPSSKFIIFHPYVYFLDIVEIAFRKMSEPIHCLRFDGRSQASARKLVLETFAAIPSRTVMLVSLGAGGVGLNITAANHVILCTPMWKAS
jgi:SNF2 family DNA or RNA helicase